MKQENRGELGMRLDLSKKGCCLWRWFYTWDRILGDSLWRLLGNGYSLSVRLCFENEMEQPGRNERAEEALETLWLHHCFWASVL